MTIRVILAFLCMFIGALCGWGLGKGMDDIIKKGREDKQDEK